MSVSSVWDELLAEGAAEARLSVMELSPSAVEGLTSRSAAGDPLVQLVSVVLGPGEFIDRWAAGRMLSGAAGASRS